MKEGKNERLGKILQIVKSEKVRSLDALRETLLRKGIDVDLSTLSRDLSEMHIGKKDGYYQTPDRFDAAVRILPPRHLTMKQFVVSCEAVGSMVVVRTVQGSADAVALQIDARMEELDCAGSVAGDDTIFAQMRSAEGAQRLVGWIEESRSAGAGREPEG